MKNLYFSYFLLISLIGAAGFAKTISMDGLKIKLTDKTGAPITKYPVEVFTTESNSKFGLSCLITSGAPDMNAPVTCEQIEYGESEKLESDSNGIVDFKLVRKSFRAFSRIKQINLRFAGTTAPNCGNLNFSKYTDQFEKEHLVLNHTVTFDEKRIDTLRKQNSGQIDCVLN